MPPRRRTFYLADATLLANPKVRRLQRRHPEWLAAIGSFHILIGVATLNESPELSDEDCDDILGEESRPFVAMLRGVGLMNAAGLDPVTFEEWLPKARPRYPSDGLPRSQTDSVGVGTDYAEKSGMPTSTSSTTSSSGSTSRHRQPSRRNGVQEQIRNALVERYGEGEVHRS